MFLMMNSIRIGTSGWSYPRGEGTWVGHFYPRGKIGLSPDLSMEPGQIGFLCQSGGNVTFMARHAASRGLHFSKIVSYGNACDIDECDLLDYFASDPETKVIAAYIEGAHDGVRLLQVLKRVTAAKPLVVFKGGFSPDGLRAATSHTGSLAGVDSVWEGLLKQAGAIRVYSIEEMVDMLVALLRVKPPKGMNVCAIGHGGGASVMATDELSAIGKLDYTIDSHAQWVGAIPDDLVYDTTEEHFTIKIDAEDKLSKGEHILTIKVTDAVGNTTYKTFEVNID